MRTYQIVDLAYFSYFWCLLILKKNRIPSLLTSIKNNKTTKSDTCTCMRPSKVLHIPKKQKNQNNKTTEQQNLIRIRVRIPQKYFTSNKNKQQNNKI